jgi:hypothetical protein
MVCNYEIIRIIFPVQFHLGLSAQVAGEEKSAVTFPYDIKLELKVKLVIGRFCQENRSKEGLLFLSPRTSGLGRE